MSADPTAPASSAPTNTITFTKPPKLRLGDVLVQQKLVSEAQLQQALEEGKQTGKRLGRLLIERGLVTEEAVVQALATQLRIPFVNLKTFPLRSDTVKLLPLCAVIVRVWPRRAPSMKTMS